MDGDSHPNFVRSGGVSGKAAGTEELSAGLGSLCACECVCSRQGP